MDKNDRDPEHTALRETEEEIGLHKRKIEVVGRLNEYVVGTGFLVSPIIGFIDPPFQITPHENEVAEVFEVPLSLLLVLDLQLQKHLLKQDFLEKQPLFF